MIHCNPYLESAPENSPNSFIYRGERVIITDMEAYFSGYGFSHEANDEIEELKIDLKSAEEEAKSAEDDREEMCDSIMEIYNNVKKALAALKKKEILMQIAQTPITDEDYRTALEEILDNVIDDISDIL